MLDLFIVLTFLFVVFVNFIWLSRTYSLYSSVINENS